MNNLAYFRKKFKIAPKADLRDVFVAADAIYDAERIAIGYLGELDPADKKSGFRIHSLLNLLGRVFEHSEGMLVAMATGSPASAEVLARTVVEGSINVMYLATFGTSSTLLHFFRSWLNEHERKLKEWKGAIQSKSYAENISVMINERSELIRTLHLYVDHIESQCSIEPIEKNTEWPKALFYRFEAMGRKTDYYESYHRLSGASHLTGEDTLLWLLALDASPSQKHKMASEAWAYSTMMTRIASTFFVDAVAACVMAYGRQDNGDLRKQKSSLEQAIQSIAKAAGVPQVP
ncbi:hypothetical protein WH50_12295 [Pokkaliibacter plantistimulans]|uniref:Uncharacterized protein n=1 Tax=Pokkaliibacter plantistimulans TaxID=1635171 RepID=A0ABX5LWI1_9GAMM|nr:DUF5677 domain-containing protein [Pokkaliibacter plantistimulans]PXF31012.1 hypothetical protein WH50_12295 [Pokkaliibacter plantistimulans]